MHSVALFFDRNSFKNGFLDKTDWSLGLLEKAQRIEDAEAREYYERLRAFDTLSLLTDYLKFNYEVNRILPLNDHLPFRETGNLTLVSDILVHCKHLRPDALAPLQEAAAQLGLEPKQVPELGRIMLSAAQSQTAPATPTL
jgi:hypothetical protein